MRDREFFEREKLKDNMQKKRLEEKLEMEMQAVNRKFELEQQLAKEQTQTTSKAKTPRLQIAEFAGEPLDWLRFWRLFICEMLTLDKYQPVTRCHICMGYL